MNYKHISSTEVISQEDYDQLAYSTKRNYIETLDAINHRAKNKENNTEDTSWVTKSIIDNNPSVDFDNGPSGDISFSGGDGGGGGASGDF